MNECSVSAFIRSITVLLLNPEKILKKPYGTNAVD